MNLWDRPAGSGGCPRSASAAPPQCFSSAVHALHLPAVSQFDPMSLGWPVEASSSRADRPLCSWTDTTGQLSSFQRRQHLLTFPIDLVQFQLWQGGEIGPAEGALAEPVDPPVFTDAAQTEAVSTGDENRAAEPVQTDTAPEELRHTRSPRLPVCRLLAAETGTPKTNKSILVGCKWTLHTFIAAKHPSMNLKVAKKTKKKKQLQIFNVSKIKCSSICVLTSLETSALYLRSNYQKYEPGQEKRQHREEECSKDQSAAL